MLSHSKFIRVVINMIFGIGDVCVCVSSLELICKLFIWWIPRKMLAHSNNAINTNVFGLSMLIAVDFTSICNAYCLFFCGCCASMCWFARLFPPLLLSLFECTLFFRLNRNRSLCQINCENAMRFLFNTIIYSRQMATNGSNHSPAQDEAHTRIRKREQTKHIRFQSKWINKNAQKKKATTRNYAERHTRRIAFSRVKWKRQSSNSSSTPAKDSSSTFGVVAIVFDCCCAISNYMRGIVTVCYIKWTMACMSPAPINTCDIWCETCISWFLFCFRAANAAAAAAALFLLVHLLLILLSFGCVCSSIRPMIVEHWALRALCVQHPFRFVPMRHTLSIGRAHHHQRH